eukprot:CAMPEP_0194531292 /NCGR_PEP_ID=MMETSP0253-20130528/68561_1 /TAXON_ID=2966 /ORGANISM="Noctiluca scintillans" /LENGTH=177 /DNA_ID=CAMNT_0039376629 /DNA_START=53 /DNA_END=586 /DNA_ORIENTATION=-
MRCCGEPNKRRFCVGWLKKAKRHEKNSIPAEAGGQFHDKVHGLRASPVATLHLHFHDGCAHRVLPPAFTLALSSAKTLRENVPARRRLIGHGAEGRDEARRCLFKGFRAITHDVHTVRLLGCPQQFILRCPQHIGRVLEILNPHLEDQGPVLGAICSLHVQNVAAVRQGVFDGRHDG